MLKRTVAMLKRVRAIFGVVVLDCPRYIWPLMVGHDRYLAVCNRQESLAVAPDGSGYRCDWRWTSDLHAPTVIPALGRWLMRRALRDHPIQRSTGVPGGTEFPDITFIIGHRGTARLSLLLATIESVAAQAGARVECIVVEQDKSPEVRDQIPEWVRYIHTPPSEDMPYCRSWAFNVGAKLAKGRVLVLHDNDLLVPTDYAAKVLHRTAEGCEVVNLKRFIFYLSERHTKGYLRGEVGLLGAEPEAIMQNAEAGGSIAITRYAYDRIGGMDESFIGWGGEDNEFWERAQTCTVWSFGSLPIVHLWHAAQPGKGVRDFPTQKRFRDLSAVSVEDRIVALRSRKRGQLDGPAVV